MLVLGPKIGTIFAFLLDVKTLNRSAYFRSNRKAQTALEYFMILALIIIPIAMTIRDAVEKGDQKNQQGLLTNMTKDTFGDQDHLGVIGRPYP